jgi:diguanylate cyclase (GGDEF)-like protein/PAS domain S-box-containing protein
MSQPINDTALRLAALVEWSRDAIISKDLTGRISSWNRAAEEMFGYTEREAVGQSIRLIIPIELYGDEDSVLAQVAGGHVVDHYETIRVRKDGRRIDVSLTVSPIVTADGTVVGASKIARDVTIQKRLERDAARLAAIVASSNDAIISKDLTGRISSWNRAAEKVFGYTETEAVGQSIRLIVPVELYDDEERVLAQVRSGHVVAHYDTIRIRKDGRRIDVSLTVSPIVTAQKRLAHEGMLLAAIVESSNDAIISKDLDGTVRSWNRAAVAIFGFSAAEIVGHTDRHIIPDDQQAQETDVLSRVRRGEYVAHYRSKRRRKDGSVFPVSITVSHLQNQEGHVVGVSAIARDVTDQERDEIAAREMTSKLAHLAGHDPLTELPNRLLLRDLLPHALASARRHHKRLAVLFLDVDRFKHINDTLGHPLGDELLRTVARELARCVRSSDTVSRQGGDEFVVVLSELEHAEDAAIGAQKIMTALAQPLEFAGHQFHVTVSIGISVFPDDSEDADTLLKNADLALYRAKEQGRDGYQFFESALNTRAIERRLIEAGLRGALDRREFELLYQPKIHLKTGLAVGAEALIRWRHPDKGLLDPARFVPIAEDCGLIVPIGRWVVQEACRQTKAWQNAGLPPLPVSVNVSATEFRARGFVNHIDDVLKQTSLDPRYLELELTETVLMAHVEAATSTLRALKALGVHLAIDDFGTGWSSLSYLNNVPMDALKIDKSFVHGIASDSATARIITAVISMGRSLKYRVIAEGVETPDQLAFLEVENCDEAQGYYFSRPLVADQFAEALGW